MRSERNYAHLLAGRLGARLVDLTVSGATTANIVDTPQHVTQEVVYPPQVDGVPGDADVVTITAGGNDLEFAAAMIYAAWLRLEPDSPAVPMLSSMFPDGIRLPSNRAVEQATAGLVRVIEKTRGKAPSARVMLVDYVTVLSDASGPATPFSDEELRQFLMIQDAIKQGLRGCIDSDPGRTDIGIVAQRGSRTRIPGAMGAALPPGLDPGAARFFVSSQRDGHDRHRRGVGTSTGSRRRHEMSPSAGSGGPPSRPPSTGISQAFQTSPLAARRLHRCRSRHHCPRSDAQARERCPRDECFTQTQALSAPRGAADRAPALHPTCAADSARRQPDGARRRAARQPSSSQSTFLRARPQIRPWSMANPYGETARSRRRRPTRCQRPAKEWD
jgi:lysophospholipase L1-like esterase